MTLDQLRALATIEVGDGYHAFPDPYSRSVTLEDAEFLYALVRVTKPTRVIESGTGMGVSARFIGEALNDNGRGFLVTYEPKKEWSDQALPLFNGLPIGAVIGVIVGAPVKPDLVFLDSEPGLRNREIEYWLTCGYPGLVCVHDAARDYDEMQLGEGVYLPGSDGLWLGRGR